jgi:hypothetical protein
MGARLSQRGRDTYQTLAADGGCMTVFARGYVSPAAAAGLHRYVLEERRRMADHPITLIPVDPSFIPDAGRQARGRDRFAEIAPDTDEIEVKVCNKVEFFDCGANFERILCPRCLSQIPFTWWQERMDEDYSDGFKLAKYATPCCNTFHTLHELAYEGTQGFGRFALNARNPKIGKFEDRYQEEFEEILGTRLRVIYPQI